MNYNDILIQMRAGANVTRTGLLPYIDHISMTDTDETRPHLAAGLTVTSCWGLKNPWQASARDMAATDWAVLINTGR